MNPFVLILIGALAAALLVVVFTAGVVMGVRATALAAHHRATNPGRMEGPTVVDRLRERGVL